MNLVGIGILAIFALCVYRGWRRGLVRGLRGVASIVISSILVSALLPSVTDFLRNNTPVYDMIVTQCEASIGSRLGSSVVSQLSGADASDSSDDSSTSDGTLNRSKIKALMDEYGLDSSRLDGMTDDQVQDYIDNYFTQYLSQIGESDQLSNISSALSSVSVSTLNSLTKIQQTRLIQSLPMPSALKKTILSFNNSEGYTRLGASGFADYLVRFIATIILDIAAFFVTMIITHMIVRAILGALDLAARFPLLYTVNRAGGLVIGVLQGLFVVWAIFLVVSALSGTQIGMTLLEDINDSILLKPLYQNNLFMQIINHAVNSII